MDDPPANVACMVKEVENIILEAIPVRSSKTEGIMGITDVVAMVAVVVLIITIVFGLVDITLNANPAKVLIPTIVLRRHLGTGTLGLHNAEKIRALVLIDRTRNGVTDDADVFEDAVERNVSARSYELGKGTQVFLHLEHNLVVSTRSL